MKKDTRMYIRGRRYPALLFPVPPDGKAAIAAACRLAVDEAKKNGFKLDEEATRGFVENIGRVYWTQQEYRETSVPTVELRDAAAGIRNEASRLQRVLEACPAYVPNAFDGRLFKAAEFPQLLDLVRRLGERCQEVEKIEPPLGRPANTHIHAAVDLATNLLSRIKGREFVHSFPELNNEFTADDAKFVCDLLGTIDPNITFSQVRSSLKEQHKRAPAPGKKAPPSA